MHEDKLISKAESEMLGQLHIGDFVEIPGGKREMVNHPNHYNAGKYEAIEVIEDWNLGFNLGNTVKYIARCEHKFSKLEDLRKAAWYLDREIKNTLAEMGGDSV